MKHKASAEIQCSEPQNKKKKKKGTSDGASGWSAHRQKSWQRGPCLLRAHLSWQPAPQCLLFDIRLVLERLVDVTGHSKTTCSSSQESMSGWGLFAWHELLGMTQAKQNENGERWHQMCRLITPCVDRYGASPQDANFSSVAPHQASLTSALALTHLHTHLARLRSVRDGSWSSFYTRLMNVLCSFFISSVCCFCFNIYVKRGLRRTISRISSR